MRLVLASFIAAIVAMQGAAPESKGGIQGKVILSSSKDPVADVQIALQGGPADPAAAMPGLFAQVAALVESGRNAGASQQAIDSAVLSLEARSGVTPVGTLTGVGGTYALKDLAPGQYSIRVQREGYFGPAVNGTSPAALTRKVTVEAGKTATADFSMVKGGVISGRIRNPLGESQVNNFVAVGSVGYASNGRQIYLLNGNTMSDDQGNFRLFWLPPGDYYVGVSPRPSGTAESIQNDWANTFYPGVIDTTQAVQVHLKEGEDLTGINMDLQLNPVGAYTVSGKILNIPAGVPNAAGTVAGNPTPSLTLVPHNLIPLDNPPATDTTISVAASVLQSGEFKVQHVRAGTYDLIAHIQEMSGATRLIRSGTTTVRVVDRDVSGLSLPLTLGAPLTGSVVVNGDSVLTGRPNTIRLTFQASERTPPALASRIGPIVVDETGAFSVPSVPQGHYTVAVSGVPPADYISDIRYAGASVFDGGVDIRPEPLSLQVVINASGATVDGTVVKKDRSVAANATVVLVPQETRRQNAALYKFTRTDDMGRFNLRGVAPGLYTVYAREQVITGAWQNKEFLLKQQGRGKPVDVVPSGKVDLQLDLITFDH